MKTKGSAGVNGRSVAFGGRGPGITAFQQGAPKPGKSAWEGKQKNGGKMATKTIRG